jgi:glutaredoxin-related protein
MAKKVIFYGSSECPDCVETKKRFDEEKIRYGYVDVLGSLGGLKKFMNLRDAHPDVYREVAERGSIGIPTVVVDDTHIYVNDLPNQNIDLFR